MNARYKIPVCPHGAAEDVDIHLAEFCDFLEREAGFTISYTSGFRCPKCNVKAGGVKNSAHLRGKAVDIAVTSPRKLYCLLEMCFMRGIGRIGIYRDHIHVDVDESLAGGVVFVK